MFYRRCCVVVGCSYWLADGLTRPTDCRCCWTRFVCVIVTPLSIVGADIHWTASLVLVSFISAGIYSRTHQIMIAGRRQRKLRRPRPAKSDLARYLRRLEGERRSVAYRYRNEAPSIREVLWYGSVAALIPASSTVAATGWRAIGSGAVSVSQPALLPLSLRPSATARFSLPSFVPPVSDSVSSRNERANRRRQRHHYVLVRC